MRIFEPSVRSGRSFKGRRRLIAGGLELLERVVALQGVCPVAWGHAVRGACSVYAWV